MKGLLIKDLRLILKQKTLLMIVLIVGVLNIRNMDAGFMAGYMIFVSMFLAINTISYDSFDNGMAYLLTMPAGRKAYAIEKYVFTMGMILCMAVITFLISVIASVANNGEIDLAMAAVVVISVSVVSFVMACVMIPFNLKFGAEKFRIILLVIVGIIVAGAYAIEEHMTNASAVLTNLIESISRMSELMLGVLLVAFVIAVVAVSVAMTIKVMNNKEF